MDATDPALDIETSALVAQTNFLDFFPQTTPNVRATPLPPIYLSLARALAPSLSLVSSLSLTLPFIEVVLTAVCYI